MRFQNYIAGRWVDAPQTITLRDFAGSAVAEVPNSETLDLVEAKAFAGRVRRDPGRRPLPERAALVRRLVEAYLADPRLEEVAAVSGTPGAYLDETARGLREWASRLEEFLGNVEAFSRARDGRGLAEREIASPFFVVSAGNAEIYEPAVILGQMVLAGTHFIVRPSGKDLGTHLFMEKVAELGLPELGQKLTWSSADKPEMIKQALRFSAGFSIFASDEAYDEMVRIQEDGQVFEDLEVGRSARRYGSGYSAAVVLEGADTAAAARLIARAAGFNKGDKCWAVTNVFVQEPCLETFGRALVEAARAMPHGHPKDRATALPSFPAAGLAELAKRLPAPSLHGEIRPAQCTMDLLVFGPEGRPLADLEVGAPVVVLLPFGDEADLVRQVRATMEARRKERLMSLGVFGDPAVARALGRQIPNHNLKVNEDLKVDIMKPHEGSYFMLDPLR